MGTTAVAERHIEEETTVKSLLIKKQIEIASMLPKHINVERFMKSALLVVARSPQLQKCTPMSVVASVINAAELGLDFTPAKGEAYLVPFWNSKNNCMEAQFMPGYRGFIALARRSGVVKNIDAHLVYTNDEFELEYGATPKLHHKPEIFKERGRVVGGYAIAFFDDETFQATFMGVEELNSIKARTKSKDRNGNITGPWVTDEKEMQKKTTVRRLFKYLPVSVDLEKAMQYDNRATRIVENEIEENGKSRTETLAEMLASTPDIAVSDDAEYEDIPAGTTADTDKSEPEKQKSKSKTEPKSEQTSILDEPKPNASKTGE